MPARRSLPAKIYGKVLHLGSTTPIVDAAVDLVPGLATQQLVKNNSDVRQLFAGPWLRTPKMFCIGAAFQSDESAQPIWKFWRRFSHIGDQIKCGAADLVFPGPNDLVVDVDSTFRLGEGSNITFEALGVGPTTHHTNYLRDGRSVVDSELSGLRRPRRARRRDEADPAGSAAAPSGHSGRRQRRQLVGRKPC